MPAPCTITELRSFLGMVGYYRSLIPNFAQIAEPLHFLTRKRTKWIWGDAQQEAFDSLKDSLTNSHVMAYPDVSKGYILYTDACDYAVVEFCVRKMKMGLRGLLFMYLTK